MTASSRRSTLERYNQKKSISGKEWLVDLLEKRRLKTSIGLLLQQRLQGAQKPKPKTYDFSSDTASADAFAAKFENARSGSCSWCVPSQNTPTKTSETIRPNTDVLCFVEKKGKMCRAKVYIRDLRTRHQTGYGRFADEARPTLPDALPLSCNFKSWLKI
jgi:hypothetical protein